MQISIRWVSMWFEYNFMFQGSSARKAYFMICERGPYAFIDGTVQLIRDSLTEGSSMQKLHCSASSYISERISVLTSLRFFMASFLAKVRYFNSSFLILVLTVWYPYVFPLKLFRYHKYTHSNSFIILESTRICSC